MGTARNGSMRTSARCRYNAGISLYSAHTGTTEGSITTVRNVTQVPVTHRRVLRQRCTTFFLNTTPQFRRLRHVLLNPKK